MKNNGMMMAALPRKETDPLLVKSGSLSSSDDDYGSPHRRCCHHHHHRPRTIMLIALICCGMMVWGLEHLVFSSSTTSATSDMFCEVTTDGGEYIVHYKQNFTTIKDSILTFGELAQLMIPPWYECSLLAIESLKRDNMDPSNIKNTRKALLTTRDLLDVFSTVYRSSSNWNKIRSYYKRGYELVGDYQDLDHSHVIYDKTLWENRQNAVLDWKKEFDTYRRKHHVQYFITEGITTRGCYNHHDEESHLFWSDYDLDNNNNGQQQRLPCGSDFATPTLQRLATIQLNNALLYLETVLDYNNALEVSQEVQYHNLRKELRSFLDEYDLFGFVLLPNATNSQNSSYMRENNNLEILRKARFLLGEVNNDWNAYNLYIAKNIHKDQQILLATKIEKEWNDFKDWATTTTTTKSSKYTSNNNDQQQLAGAIQSLLIEMTTQV